MPAPTRFAVDSGSSDGGHTTVIVPRSGACVHCKSLKVRCEFPPGSVACQRCSTSGIECIARTRKKRKPAPTHEELQEKAYEQDAQIQRLLQQFDQLKIQTQLNEWIRQAMTDTPSKGGSGSDAGINLQSWTPKVERVHAPNGGFPICVKSEDPMGFGLDHSLNYWTHDNDSILEREAAAQFPLPKHQGLGYGLSRPSVAPIVRYCKLQPDAIRELFHLYFERINSFFSILDDKLHTPERLIWTSHFLFTVIIATAARFYARMPHLYKLATNIAMDMAGRYLTCTSSAPPVLDVQGGSTVSNSFKSVDVCQAYLILAVYPRPKKRWSDDRSWLLMGVAIRMAIELELNLPPGRRPPSSEDPEAKMERELQELNRTRTWLNCYCVDGSHAIQFGKMPMIPFASFSSRSDTVSASDWLVSPPTSTGLTSDYLAVHCKDWYQSSSLNNPFDVHLTAYVQLLRIMGSWKALCAGDNGNGELTLNERWRKGFDIVAASLKTQESLASEMASWVRKYEVELHLNPLKICAYRGNTTQMITEYLKLVVLAVGFQYAVKEGLGKPTENKSMPYGKPSGMEVLQRSIDAARGVIQITIERLYPTGHLKYAMEAHFLYMAFAAAYLINLLRPKFLPLIDRNTQEDIIFSVRELINVLSSQNVALDGRHTPMSYARFLKMLMEKRRIPELPGHLEAPGSGGSSTTIPLKPGFADSITFNDINFPRIPDANGRQVSPTYWPDVPLIDHNGGFVNSISPMAGSSLDINNISDDAGMGLMYGSGDVDMDFTLNHFVRTVSAEIPPPHLRWAGYEEPMNARAGPYGQLDPMVQMDQWDFHYMDAWKR